ncbi:MAG: hypothetical protein KGL39_60285, partial [Patescibacteria group bacterium]|nr:hypothetical protein [Patescibacteria group bacterium]
ILTARHVQARVDCECRSPCCCGTRPNRLWLDPVAELAHEASKLLPGCVSHTRMRMGIVGRYFGTGEKLKALAEQCHVSADMATAHNAKIVEWLKRREDRAYAEIGERLKKIGIAA